MGWGSGGGWANQKKNQGGSSAWRDTRVKDEPGNQMDDAYLKEWETRDAQLQANGFGPSKLGPGVPAQIEEPNALGRMLGVKPRAWDDSGIEIPYDSSMSE